MIARVSVIVTLGVIVAVLAGGDGVFGDPETVQRRAVIVMEPDVRWVPASPGEGTLAQVVVRASEHTPVMGARGSAHGEELHFRRLDDRTLVSFAGVPVGVGDSATATVTVAYREGGEATISARAPVTAGVYAHERLTVAPRFGAPLSPEDSARLDGERGRARAVAARAHRTGWSEPSEATLPRPGPVTSGFGDGREFNGRISSRHMGLDLRGARGDTAYAAAAGVVELVDDFLLAGRLVYINHGAGVVTGYFHLSDQLVDVGDSVRAGDPIGLVGATGRVTGPHLHWVLRYGSISLDPRSLLTVLGQASPDGGDPGA